MNEIYANILNAEDKKLLEQVKLEYSQMLLEKYGRTEPIIPRIKSGKIYHIKCAGCNKAFMCDMSTRRLCGACRVVHRNRKH